MSLNSVVSQLMYPRAFTQVTNGQIVCEPSRICTVDLFDVLQGESRAYIRLIPDGMTREEDDARTKAMKEFKSWFDDQLQ